MKYHNKFGKNLFTKKQGFNHMVTGLSMFGGLAPDTLEENASSTVGATETCQAIAYKAQTEGGDTWKQKSEYVCQWMRSTPHIGMSFLLAANKFLAEIRSGTTCGYSDIEGDTFSEKLKYLKTAHNPKAVQNFMLAVISDLAGLYPANSGLGNHPFFKSVNGPPSVAMKNEFLKIGVKGLEKLLKKMDEYAASLSVPVMSIARVIVVIVLNYSHA